jgi:hypothetical protein
MPGAPTIKSSNNRMLITIGVNIISDIFLNRGISNVIPNTISNTLITDRYPVEYRTPINVAGSPSIGGSGIKFRKKFNPNTIKINDSK